MSAKDQLEQIAKRRREVAKKVAIAPEGWKVCVGCESLNAAANIFCPFCRSYGFEFDRDQIVAMGLLLGTRPIAVTCALLPRDTRVGVLTNA